MSLAVLVVGALMVVQDAPGVIHPDAVLGSGAFAVPAALHSTEETRTEVATEPELDLRRLWPRASDFFTTEWGTQTWNAVALQSGSAELELGEAGGPRAWYGAFYVWTDRRGAIELELSAAGSMELFVDGRSVAAEGAAAEGATTASATPELVRGMHRVLLRLQTEAASSTLRVSLRPEDGQSLRCGIDPRHAVADYDELRSLHAVSGLQLSPDAQLLARVVSAPHPDRDGSERRLEVVELDGGRRLLSWPGATALTWRADGRQLLVRQGSSVWTWTVASGEVHPILHDEPGLGAIQWSADGKTLVFSSTRGAPASAGDGPQRRTELREKLDDWPTRPHLHRLVLESGFRRRLSLPGDWVQDSFHLEPDGQHLVTLRNRARRDRPFFDTEVRRVDLRTMQTREVATLQMGFENRPGLSGFAVSPDARWMAFVGPPSELGDRASLEPNAFDPDLFVMNLADGRWRKISAGLRASIDGHLHWTTASTLCFQATDGSRSTVYVAQIEEDSYSIPVVPEAVRATWPERIHDLSFARDGRCVFVGSDTATLPRMYQARPGERATVFESPNQQLQDRWVLSQPTDFGYEAADGARIEGWLYRPLEDAPAEGFPLIVYYYGGASPTLRGFNELHQFLVARGYALLVLNPRGAAGYGQPFADHHAGDWGEKAGADILQGLELALRQNPDLDGSSVGCYGGSFGGFMTMYLLSQTDRFAAGVSLYGISNLASYWGDGMWGWTYGDQAMAGRTPWSDPQWFVRQSPLFLADRIHTPLLLLHGLADGNVPPNESEQMFSALRLLDRPCELVTFPGEDHGLRGTWENRVRHRTMLVEWFDRYLRDRPEGWAARWD